jgi:hypothetical protein
MLIITVVEHKVFETGSTFVLRSVRRVIYSGPMIEVSSFYGTQKSRCLPTYLKKETDTVSEMLCSPVFRMPDDGQRPKPH